MDLRSKRRLSGTVGTAPGTGLLGVAVVAVLAAGLLAIGTYEDAAAATAPLGVPETSLASGTPSSAPPVGVEIPAIGVAAPIDALGLDGNGELAVPTEYGRVGWWSGGAQPGDIGAAVLVGHVDSTDGPAVFHKLEKLRPGDEIRVTRSDGRIAVFLVERLASRKKNDFPTEEVYGQTDQPALRLITCFGSFRDGSYVSNLIVFARPAP